jgi:AcrR family transcriptional regulator
MESIGGCSGADFTVCKVSTPMGLYIVSSATRILILDAALACASHGNGFTMAGVAAQAGLSRQAVYLHFSSRNQLLAALAAHTARPAEQQFAAIAAAPSARVALAAMIAELAASHPVLAGLGDPGGGRLALCAAMVDRFQVEGALAPHLSRDTARDLLWSLTSPAIWKDLVTGRGWPVERYRNHVGFLAVGALTR